MKREFWLAAAVALMFGIIGTMVGLQRYHAEPAPTGAGRAILAQTLAMPDGRQVALSHWKGKTIVANFWATWCAPCVEEMPELSGLQSQLVGKNIQIIGIGIDSSDKIREFSVKHKIAYPLFVAGTEGLALSRQAGNHHGGLPFTIVIDASGQITHSYLGRLDMPALRKDLGLL